MNPVVIDASAVVTVLVFDDHRAGEVEQRLRSQDVFFAPTLLDYEVLSSLRGIASKDKRLTNEIVNYSLADLRTMPIRREDAPLLSLRIWELRHNYTAYDAAYVALAEKLGATLLTCDVKMANAAGARCAIDVLA